MSHSVMTAVRKLKELDKFVCVCKKTRLNPSFPLNANQSVIVSTKGKS